MLSRLIIFNDVLCALLPVIYCSWNYALQEMERSADVLAAGLVELADPSLSSKFFLRQVCL